MISMALFVETFVSTVTDVIPIISIIFGFQFAVLRKPIVNFPKVLLGFFYWVE